MHDDNAIKTDNSTALCVTIYFPMEVDSQKIHVICAHGRQLYNVFNTATTISAGTSLNEAPAPEGQKFPLNFPKTFF